MEIIFWLSFSLIFYVYFGYPLFLLIANKLIKEKPVDRRDIYPTVSLIISAYNEETCIEEKIKNSLELEYPEESVEIIVVSDGSSDGTNEIIERLNSPRLKSFFLEKQRGKTAAQNLAVENSTGEILVFTDANALFKKDALKKIVRNFNDNDVGGVCGELQYIDNNSSG